MKDRQQINREIESQLHASKKTFLRLVDFFFRLQELERSAIKNRLLRQLFDVRGDLPTPDGWTAQ